MTLSTKPPLAGKDQFETYCPLCRYPGSRCMIAFDPNRKTLRYECDKCDYEFDVPHRLPKAMPTLEDDNFRVFEDDVHDADEESLLAAEFGGLGMRPR
jgi:hypothetical protein